MRRRRVHLTATDGGGIIKCARVCAACEVLTCSTRPRLVHALYPACYYWVAELRKATTDCIYTKSDCKAATFSRARRMHSWPRCTRSLPFPAARDLNAAGRPVSACPKCTIVPTDALPARLALSPLYSMMRRDSRRAKCAKNQSIKVLYSWLDIFRFLR